MNKHIRIRICSVYFVHKQCCCHKNMFEVAQTRKQQILTWQRKSGTTIKKNQKNEGKNLHTNELLSVYIKTNTNTCSEDKNTIIIKYTLKHLHRCAFIHSSIAWPLMNYWKGQPMECVYVTVFDWRTQHNKLCNALYTQPLVYLYILYTAK